MPDEYQWHFDYTRLVRDSGFTFQAHRPKSSIIKNLAHIDIEKIILHQDIALVDKNINTVLEYTLDNEQSSVLDQNFVKVFYISQLSVQYLLFCKKYLDSTVAHLKKEVANNKEVINNLNQKVSDAQQEATSSKSQIKELQTTLNCQIANTQSIPVFQCNQCPKAFSTEEYLLAHIQRRHENFGHGTSFQVETDKLQSEIKALKERLNNTEKLIHYDDDKFSTKITESCTKNNAVENTLLTELQHRFEMLKAHVDNELRMLQTQKYDQDKYEKWFETFLRKLDCYNSEKSSKSVQSDNVKGCETCLQKNDERITLTKDDHTTQTDLIEIDQPVCKNCHNEVSSHCSTATTKSSVGRRVNEKPLGKAEDTIEKLEELLQQRVTGSIEKLETQMQSFCNKMHEFEQNFSSHRTTPSPTHTPEIKVPKQRKRWNPRPMNGSTTYMTNIPPSPKLSPILKVIEIKPQATEVKPTPSSVTPVVTETDSKTPKPIIGFDHSDESESQNPDLERKDSVSETDSSERINTETFIKPVTSQAKQKPMTRLKNVAAALSLQQNRQKEMIDLLNKKLIELGISKDWSGLPSNSFQRALSIVNHQSNLVKKTFPNYNRVKDNVLKNLDEEVRKRQGLAAKTVGSSNTKRYKRQTKTVEQMYATESETESDSTIKSRKKFTQNKENTNKAYFEVVREFNLRTKSKDDTSDLSVDTDTSARKDDVKIERAKSVLKNYPSVASLQKKKVFFNLKSDKDDEKLEIVQLHDGSTSSIGSSVLDGSKVNLHEN